MDSVHEEWSSDPEPAFPSKNPQVILDCNIDGQAWLYDTMNESDAYLVFKGDVANIVS